MRVSPGTALVPGSFSLPRLEGTKLDRYAIFVDAGYVLVAGGELCCGTGSRLRLDLDVAKLRDHLNQIAAESTGLSALRMYWYDAAPYTGPTEHHNEIARLPNVKLRLGRIKSRKQKGVDALIYHDLINLAREKAICDAFLVSGDEDLREGVRTIQGLGVRVTLIGIPPRHQSTNQSLELIQEADERVLLTKDVLSRFFRLRPRQGGIDTPKEADTPRDTDNAPGAPTHSDIEIARAAGASLAKAIMQSPEYGTVLSSRPRIPQEIDRQLLRSLRQDLTTFDVRDDLRREARTSFWKTLSTPDRPSTG